MSGDRSVDGVVLGLLVMNNEWGVGGRARNIMFYAGICVGDEESQRC